MTKFIAAAKKFVKAEEGASLVEYGLLVALIAVVCIAGMQALGVSINTMFTGIGTTLGGISTSS